MIWTILALLVGGGVLLADKHLPLVLASRRPRPARGLIERIFWKTDPPS